MGANDRRVRRIPPCGVQPLPCGYAASMSQPFHPPSLAGEAARLRPPVDDPVARTASWAHGLLDAGLLDLPLPGRGATPERYSALAELGSVDLDLARLVEAHTDALAILSDLGAGDDPGPWAGRPGRELWGVWAANPPAAPLVAQRSGGTQWRLEGTKPWCSGAGTCDRALVTARTDEGYRLFAVHMAGGTASPVRGSWSARSMTGSDSRAVRFDSHPALAVGDPEAYLERPGFWHGAVGVAAVWLGGAAGVADALSRAHSKRPLDPHALAHAGAVDAALAAAGALLRDTAAAFDADPKDDTSRARLLAGRTRAVVEQTATAVVDRVGRALGAGPLAMDPEHARRVGDLLLYLRQSHAERDLAALGGRSLEVSPDDRDRPW